MKIFTEEAIKEVVRFLPHYIIVSGILAVSLFAANLATNVATELILHKNGPQGMPQGPEMQQPQNGPRPEENNENGNFDEDEEALLPSDYKIGLPFAEAVKDNSKPLVVEFYADWCPHCRNLTPMFAEVSEMVDSANFTTVNTQADENSYLVKKYQIEKFPTVLIINTKTGKMKELEMKQETSSPEGLKSEIEKLVKTIK